MILFCASSGFRVLGCVHLLISYFNLNISHSLVFSHLAFPSISLSHFQPPLQHYTLHLYSPSLLFFSLTYIPIAAASYQPLPWSYYWLLHFCDGMRLRVKNNYLLCHGRLAVLMGFLLSCQFLMCKNVCVSLCEGPTEWEKLRFACTVSHAVCEGSCSWLIKPFSECTHLSPAILHSDSWAVNSCQLVCLCFYIIWWVFHCAGIFYASVA